MTTCGSGETVVAIAPRSSKTSGAAWSKIGLGSEELEVHDRTSVLGASLCANRWRSQGRASYLTDCKSIFGKDSGEYFLLPKNV